MKDQKRKKDTTIIFNIDSDTKKQFNIKCLENNINMTEAILGFIQEYVQK